MREKIEMKAEKRGRRRLLYAELREGTLHAHDRFRERQSKNKAPGARSRRAAAGDACDGFPLLVRSVQSQIIGRTPSPSRSSSYNLLMVPAYPPTPNPPIFPANHGLDCKPSLAVPRGRRGLVLHVCRPCCMSFWRSSLHRLTHAHLSPDGLRVSHFLPWSSWRSLRSLLHFKSNKTVLNSTPDVPLFFLFLQLLIAVLLLHVTALFSSRIEIPQWDSYTAKKLLPVVTINIVGLVFNTLCLREVEATFFQVFIYTHLVLYYRLNESPLRSQEAWSYL